jgi:Ca2+-binding RTX toxin-like protein
MSADTVKALGGNDTIDGLDGADSMEGGHGDDLYHVDSSGDVVVEAVGGGAHDKIISSVATAYSLAAGVEVEILETLGDGNLIGNEFAQLLKGAAGENELQGGGGNDTLDGGAGFDVMLGNTGDDLYFVDQGNELVQELAGEGHDTVSSSASYTLGADVEDLMLTGAGDLDGTGNGLANKLTGNAFDNDLYGLAGNDTLIGSAGGDTMYGGGGDDTYEVADDGDLVVEEPGQGTDTVNASISYTLTPDVENLILKGSAGLTGTGNGLVNTLKGNSGNNSLNGLGGNDTLDGQGGNDTMVGGMHDDTYTVGQVGDVVTELANEGIDTVHASFDYTLGANVENLTLIAGSNAIGNALANAITGNAGANVINGQGGADTMSGLAGGDTYIVDNAGDGVVEGANGGTDTVQAGVDYTLAVNLETLVLAGSALKGTGNSAANTLIGNALANTLKGGAGDDTMDGGAGKDALEGGKGNDTYVLGGSKDKVTDNKGADDTITSTITRKLADYTGIENLKLEGTDHINGTGNGADNDLVGNVGKNQLKGEAGNDLIRGLAGADQLWGGGGADTFDFDVASDIRKASGKRDIIKDFQHLNDKIDLSTIDANSILAGDQAFKFKAAEGTAFAGAAGQLIWDQKDAAGTSSDRTLVSGDINGDGVADFTLELSGLVNLTKADFIL